MSPTVRPPHKRLDVVSASSPDGCLQSALPLDLLGRCSGASWMAWVNSWRRSMPTNVHSLVIWTSVWPPILEASIARPPTSCR